MGTICDQEQTKSQEQAYRVLLRDYGEGLVEATVTINSSRPRNGGSPLASVDPELRAMDNADRAARRARAAVRQSIMACQLDHMVTLTYRENQLSPELAWKHFGRFMRMVRQSYLKQGYPFVAVLERQKRGAMHIHMAVHGQQDVALLRKLWHQAIGSKEGNIDVKYFRQKLPKLARYLSKYITKDFGADHEQGDHRYKRSRGIVIPSLIIYLPHDKAVELELNKLFDQCGAVVEHVDNSLAREGPKWLWACSW